MTTRDRAQDLAAVAAHFSLLGRTTAEDLLAWVKAELGHEQALDDFVPWGGHHARALAPGVILHIVSGNTPHAALQSLVAGLLLGSRNLVKIPSAGLPEVEEFARHLSPELADLVECSPELPGAWMSRADAVIVYGSDDTLATLRARVPAGKIFLGYGHKLSFGVVFDDPGGRSCAPAAADASLFDQQGCLSPHVFYVRNGGFPGGARAFAGGLAREMAAFNERHPRGPLAVEDAAAVANLRAAYRFRAANDASVALWEGSGAMDWTVIYEEDPWFVASCLHRVVFVKPLPDNLAEAAGPALPFLGAIGIHPATAAHARALLPLRPSRICALGRMQAPPWTWHNDGRPRLAPLVKWVDFESAEG